MPAAISQDPRWGTFCTACGTADDPLRLDPEGPLNADLSVALRVAHDKVFHGEEKTVTHVSMERFHVICTECYPDRRHLLDEAIRDDAVDFKNMHNQAFHSPGQTAP